MRTLTHQMCLVSWSEYFALSENRKKAVLDHLFDAQPHVVSFLEEYGEDYMSDPVVTLSMIMAGMLLYVYTFHGATISRVRRERLEYHLPRHEAFVDALEAQNKLEQITAIYESYPQPILRIRLFSDAIRFLQQDLPPASEPPSESETERKNQLARRMQMLLGAILDAFEEVAVEESGTPVRTAQTKK